MDINGVESARMSMGVYGAGFSPPSREGSDEFQYTPCMEQLDISQTGKMMNAISLMDEEEMAEMRSFHQKIMEAMEDGTFDASQMAAEAPDSLVAFAEENGVDLTQMIEDMASGMERMKGAPPPPPPMMSEGGGGSLLDDLTEEELAELEAFKEEIVESLMNGTFDASELAANAPDALTAFAEENDIDLTQMIEDMASGPGRNGGPPPPPPPIMYGANGSGISSYEDPGTDLLGEMLAEEETEDSLLSA